MEGTATRGGGVGGGEFGAGGGWFAWRIGLAWLVELACGLAWLGLLRGEGQLRLPPRFGASIGSFIYFCSGSSSSNPID